jgi:hypothetical protein
MGQKRTFDVCLVVRSLHLLDIVQLPRLIEIRLGRPIKPWEPSLALVLIQFAVFAGFFGPK